eukprot:820450-Prymnesium_polylepis.1
MKPSSPLMQTVKRPPGSRCNTSAGCHSFSPPPSLATSTSTASPTAGSSPCELAASSSASSAASVADTAVG